MNYIAVLLVFMCAVTAAQDSDRAATVRMPIDTVHPRPVAPDVPAVNLPADPFQLVETAPDDHLTELSRQAVDWAPDWLRGDLRDNFAWMDPSFQDIYADMILNPSELRFTDEIAFCVANIAPEILQDAEFLPEMLEENAHYIYEHDQYLDYVRIEDTGLPGEDNDYWSTTLYNVEEGGGTTEHELDRDMYYWFIVHPKIEDEMPRYADPSASGGAFAPPPTGVFWRDWLFTHTEPMAGMDDDHPILRDQFAGVDVLWKSTVNSLDNGAVGVVTQWVLDVLDFTSGSERPKQPVRIYS
ncbi:hypothetical protein JW905_14295, partial [bacterium]|nr:hypothetical protein [candidate division CSSED10-310 bacterium]